MYINNQDSGLNCELVGLVYTCQLTVYLLQTLQTRAALSDHSLLPVQLHHLLILIVFLFCLHYDFPSFFPSSHFPSASVSLFYLPSCSAYTS